MNENRDLIDDLFKLLLLKSNGWAIDRMSEEVFDTIFLNWSKNETNHW